MSKSLHYTSDEHLEDHFLDDVEGYISDDAADDDDIALICHMAGLRSGYSSSSYLATASSSPSPSSNRVICLQNHLFHIVEVAAIPVSSSSSTCSPVPPIPLSFEEHYFEEASLRTHNPYASVIRPEHKNLWCADFEREQEETVLRTKRVPSSDTTAMFPSQEDIASKGIDNGSHFYPQQEQNDDYDCHRDEAVFAPRKHEMCCYFKKYGSCKMGDACWYGHEGSQDTPCHYGLGCRFKGHRELARAAAADDEAAFHQLHHSESNLETHSTLLYPPTVAAPIAVAPPAPSARSSHHLAPLPMLPPLLVSDFNYGMEGERFPTSLQEQPQYEKQFTSSLECMPQQYYYSSPPPHFSSPPAASSTQHRPRQQTSSSNSALVPADFPCAFCTKTGKVLTQEIPVFEGSKIAKAVRVLCGNCLRTYQL